MSFDAITIKNNFMQVNIKFKQIYLNLLFIYTKLKAVFIYLLFFYSKISFLNVITVNAVIITKFNVNQ